MMLASSGHGCVGNAILFGLSLTSSQPASRFVIDPWRAPVLGRVGGDVGDSGSPSCAVLALFAVGDVYVSLCKKSAYAPFSVRRRS